MAMNTAPTGNLLEVNEVKIYHEVRGSGPSVLFIAGATGDCGHFQRVAELLSDEFTVVTYDRRGNSRSPRPKDWEGTSTEEHSEDAAALIEALGLAPAAVFGNSAGAIIGLDLSIRRPALAGGAAAALIGARGLAPVAVCGNSAGAIIGLDLSIRRPELVRGAILHEPPMMAGMSNPEEMMGAFQQVVEGGMQSGGLRGGVEAFFRFVAGDETFEKLDPQLRERMLGNGETCLVTEMPVFPAYEPAAATPARSE